MQLDGTPSLAALTRRAGSVALAWFRKRPWLALFLVLVAAFTLIGANSVSARSVTIAESSPGVSANPVPSFSASIALPEIYVHVVGEVVRPGLYVVPAESRLVDAIAMAGGFTRRADQSSVNLARVLTDAEQLVVLPKGQSVVGAAGASAAGAGAASGGAGVGARISLNRASQSQLESLPRVGPALAGRIIDWRTANGGFRSIDDLLKVSGFGDKMFAAIKSLVSL